uniref:Uncharacterized protein n=1 Tax=Magallana gigas TaxID=29159 RepID=K1R825_MAGGI
MTFKALRSEEVQQTMLIQIKIKTINFPRQWQLRLLMSTTKGIFHYNSQQHRFRTTASYVIYKHNQNNRLFE